MSRPDNRRTEQICRFIVENGIPTTANEGTFESVALNWINEIRNNQTLHPTDKAIIHSFGLEGQIFPVQLVELQRQISELTKKLADLTNHSMPAIQLVANQRRVKNKCRSERLESALKFCNNPDWYERKIIDYLQSNSQFKKSDLHGCYGRKLPSGLMTLMIRKLVADGTILEFSVNPSLHRNVTFYRAGSKPWVPTSITQISGHFDGILKQWNLTIDGKTVACSIAQLRSFFYMEEIPEDENSRPFMNCWCAYRNYFVTPQLDQVPFQTPVQTSVQTPVQTSVQTPVRIIIDAKRTHRHNPNIIWAKAYSGEYQREVDESEIIGKVIWKNNDVTVEYGIQNYGIYPSGTIKLYLRYPKRNGRYGCMITKWSTCPQIVSINLKPEYDFGPIS